MLGLGLGREVSETGLYGKCRVTGAEGVVLMRNGRTGNRHDAVAKNLVNCARILTDRSHHLGDGTL
jgi:hypothetical protein